MGNGHITQTWYKELFSSKRWNFDPAVQEWKKQLDINQCTANQWDNFYYKTNSYSQLLKISRFFWFPFIPELGLITCCWFYQSFQHIPFCLLATVDFHFCNQETCLGPFLYLPPWQILWLSLEPNTLESPGNERECIIPCKGRQSFLLNLTRESLLHSLAGSLFKNGFK